MEVVVPSYVTTATATRINTAFRNLEDTTKAVFWDVAWVAWTKNRPEGGSGDSWNDGTGEEEWVQGTSGTGRLRANGGGGPVIAEEVIYQQAPYRLRTDVSAALTAHTWLVIDSTRLFKVVHFEDRGGDRQHANAYLTEEIGVTLPVAVTP